MSLELKNNSDLWQPSASLSVLKERAILLEDIRSFFKAREVLEVDTPLMCRSAAIDPHLKPIPVLYSESEHALPQHFYLQTSPEFAMKRLLAAGSGSIYQISKAFRNGEVGRFHNPEFTMLEWYRVGFDHHQLMDEMDDFLALILSVPKAKRVTYEALFLNYLSINPHQVSLQQLKDCAFFQGIHLHAQDAERLTLDDWLDLLMSHCIEPKLGFEHPVMIYDFPVSKAALAKVRKGSTDVGERFEVYVQGLELANGYHELTDSEIQWQRFQADCKTREQLNLSKIPIDSYLIEALKKGLPDSAGVALGVDRLLMLKLKSRHIQEVVSFTIDRV